MNDSDGNFDELNLAVICEGLGIAQTSSLITTKIFSRMMGTVSEKNSVRFLKVHVSEPFELGDKPPR
jgi:hypothetical protein